MTRRIPRKKTSAAIPATTAGSPTVSVSFLMSHGTATSTGASTLPAVAPGAYASAVHIGDERVEVATAEDAVRLPLPGGW
jgi:hypothetical protein